MAETSTRFRKHISMNIDVLLHQPDIGKSFCPTKVCYDKNLTVIISLKREELNFKLDGCINITSGDSLTILSASSDVHYIGGRFWQYQ